MNMVTTTTTMLHLASARRLYHHHQQQQQTIQLRTYVRQMVGNTNEYIDGFFKFMMTRAQQARAVAARASDSQQP